MLTHGICDTFRFNFFCASVFRLVNIGFLQITVVEFSVSDFVDSCLNGLHLGHILLNGNRLILVVIETLCRSVNFCKLDRDGGSFPNGIEELFVVLYIAT